MKIFSKIKIFIKIFIKRIPIPNSTILEVNIWRKNYMKKNYKKFKTSTKFGLITLTTVVILCLASIMVSASSDEEYEGFSGEVQPFNYYVNEWHTIEGYLTPQPFQLKLFSSFNIALIEGPSSNSDVVYIYVNTSLWNSGGSGSELQNKILRYKHDMEATGYKVWLWEYIDGSPENIKTNLTGVTDLVGCVFIGNIPTAWYQYFHDPGWGHANYSEFPIDLFYMDLDGTWSDIYDNPTPNWGGWGASIPLGSDGIYDVHTGNVAPEIWIGRIKGDDMADPEADLVKTYFDKNHDYRIGESSNPQRALIYVDDDWSPADSVRDAVKEAFPVYTHITDKNATKKDNYLENISDGYNWVHVLCHGNSGSHSFKIPGGGGSVYEGPSVTWNSYRSGDYPVFFYNLFVCSGARFTSSNYLGGWCIFSGDGLAALGSTKTGSIIYNDNFYTPLKNGDNLGEAYQSWFIDTLSAAPSADKPWYYGMTLLGDPTLWATGQHSVTINTNGLPDSSGSNVIHYTSGGVLQTGSIVGGSWTGNCDHGTNVNIYNSLSPPPGDERYSTLDNHSWTVNGPATHTVNYHHQYKVILSTNGLTWPNVAEVDYTQHGTPQTISNIHDSNGFYEWCDIYTSLEIENPVIITADQERYYSTDQTYWSSVSSAITETIHYTHQFKITCTATTQGITPLNAGNHVTISYVKSSSPTTYDIYDSQSLSDWMDAGTTYTFENPSSSSDSNHRWYTPSTTSYIITTSTTTNLIYYEQFWTKIYSTGGLLTSTYQGTTNYLQLGMTSSGNYYDSWPWKEWCDAGTTLTASEIVQGPTNERYHTQDTTTWTITSSEIYYLNYHKEYKITINADGLLDTISTDITIGTANPSPSDDISGGDSTPYILTLDIGNGFSWTNWIHADTTLTALDLIEISKSEKFILLCWTKDVTRYPPPTVNGNIKGITYTAHYAGLKKEMSEEEANLTNPIQVSIEISNPSTGTTSDTVEIVDDLPNEMSYVIGSAKIDDISYTPQLDIIDTPEKHQRLTFTVDGNGKHNITFEIKINRAYATDTIIQNNVSATFKFEYLTETLLDVLFNVTIHPYIGQTISKATDGPEIIPLFTQGNWIFTYIVKNNYDYPMNNSEILDYFGAELDYYTDTIIANLLTNPIFTYSTGNQEQLRFKWTLPDITSGEAFMLQVTTYTKMTPNGNPKQLYATLGEYILNSGATLKWYDNNKTKQSLETETISVTAVGQIQGYVKDQYDNGVEGVIIEIYYNNDLVATTETDSTGQYNIENQLIDSGTYTAVITDLPNRYSFGSNPSEKTTTYNVGQIDPSEINFDVEKTKGK